MYVDVIMPKLGESIVEGTVLTWRKAVGDAVLKDEILLEVSTDKVDSEIPSLEAGVLAEICVAAGTRVDVGAILGRLRVGGDEDGNRNGNEIGDGDGDGDENENENENENKNENENGDENGDGDGDAGRSGKGRRFYSPLVMRIAREEGISNEVLEAMGGSGRGGRVTKEDVAEYLRKRAATRLAPQEDSARVSVVGRSGGKVETELAPAALDGLIPLDTVQRKMAHHMRQSLDTAAHAWSMFEVDLTVTQRALEAQRERVLADAGVKLTLNHFVLQAVVRALTRFPLLNAKLEGESWRKQPNIGLGVAVASPKGLVVPVLRNAQDLSFVALARTANEVTSRARTGKLVPDDLVGSTFTVTNYGVFGQDAGLPIINQPNVAILGIGAAKKRPIVIESPRGDSLGIGLTAWLTLGFDHRLVDGQSAASFLKAVKEELEEGKV